MRERFTRLTRGLADNLHWFAPLLAALLCITATLSALHSLTYAALGRDQGIFQYVAWALRHGQKAYRDVHEINGPLPHAWNVLVQSAAGEDAHAFRAVDTLFVILVYGAAAYTLPRWVGVTLSRRSLLAWVAAGVAVLGAQFVRYDWWHANQREGFYAALVLGSVALQIAAHHTRSEKNAFWLFCAAAMVTSLTWFGKPPCVVFAILQLGVLVFDRASLAVTLDRVAYAAGLGVGVSTALMVAFVAAYEDAGAGLRLLATVPLLHHTIWNHSLLECYRAYDNAPRLDWAMATSAGFVVAYFVFRLPRRSLLSLVLPMGGFIVFAAQGKAFPYHLHMLTLGTSLAQLVILAALVHRASERRDALVLAASTASIALGIKCRDDARLSAAGRSDWSTLGSTKDKRAALAYLERFGWGDFYLADLQAAAKLVGERTGPDDRIQTYGLDPYFLFLARRHTATPIIYNFELNIDPALDGGEGARLTGPQRVQLGELRNATEHAMLTRVTASPPAAFVFFDKAPFGHPDDGERDFAEHCPSVHRWVDQHYAPAERVGTVRVRLRLAGAHAAYAP
jgi:hypothetical protein